MESNLQASLLAEDLPPGYSIIPDFITAEEEKSLLEEIAKIQWEQVKLHGVVARRQVAHYGLDYVYERRTPVPGKPIPTFLNPFTDRAAKALSIRAEDLVEILISSYPPGAGIGWHRDAEPFGDAVFGFSLASTTHMKLKKVDASATKTPSEIYKIELRPRDAYIISGPSRWDWHHSISPVKSQRYSITFRTLSEI